MAPGVGWTEVVFIVLLALLVIKPEKLPKALRSLAEFYRKVRQTVSKVNETLAAELRKAEEIEELKNIASDPVLKELRGENLSLSADLKKIYPELGELDKLEKGFKTVVSVSALSGSAGAKGGGGAFPAEGASFQDEGAAPGARGGLAPEAAVAQAEEGGDPPEAGPSLSDFEGGRPDPSSARGADPEKDAEKS
ncbi:MAG: hypothetical protein LBR53_09915 [Deltaproteobacteria bacterium]|jgi:sec-independent protein translocase protein TatB|nr:hypothetical protein [Deltaproteobacteria bacterium]